MILKGKRFVLVLTAIFSFLLLTGCAESTLIDRRAVVQVIGIDAQDGNFVATLGYFSPKGGSEQPIDPKSSNIEIVSGEGITMSEAIREAVRPKGKEPFYAQNSIVIIGQSACNHHLREIIDFINFDIDFQVNAKIFAAENEARDLIRPEIDLGVLPGELVSRLADISAEKGSLFHSEYFRFADRFYSPFLSAALPVLTVDPEDKAVYRETALICGERWLGTLNLDETRDALFLSNQLKTTPLDLTASDASPLSLDIVESETQIRPVIEEDGSIVFEVEINNLLDLREYHPQESKNKNGRDNAELDRLVSNHIKENCERTFYKLMREERADILGYGSRLCWTYPEMTETVEKSWSEMLRTVRCTVTVKNRFE